MIVKQIISKSRYGKRMEVIAKDNNGLHTLHIHRGQNSWKYFAGCNKNDVKIFSSITV